MSTNGAGVDQPARIRLTGASPAWLAVATAALVALTSGATAFVVLAGTGDVVRSTPTLEPLPSPASPPARAPVVVLPFGALGESAVPELPPPTGGAAEGDAPLLFGTPPATPELAPLPVVEPRRDGPRRRSAERPAPRTGGNSDADRGQPNRGQPNRGQPKRGQPDRGQPDEGQPDEGQPDKSGQPDQGGQPDRGQPDHGQPDKGESDQGQPEDQDDGRDEGRDDDDRDDDGDDDRDDDRDDDGDDDRDDD